jgi:hypothetical protein
MHRTRSSSPKSINLCHLLDMPSSSLESVHESDMWETHSPSPVLSQNSDFRIPEPISSGPQEDIGMRHPLHQILRSLAAHPNHTVSSKPLVLLCVLL